MKNPLKNLCEKFNLDLIEIIYISSSKDKDKSSETKEIEKFYFSRGFIRAKDIKFFRESEVSVGYKLFQNTLDRGGRDFYFKEIGRKTIETLKTLTFSLENEKNSSTGILPAFAEGVYKKTLDRIIAIEVSRKLKGEKS